MASFITCDINIDIGNNGMIYIYLDGNDIQSIKYLDTEIEMHIKTDWDNIRDIFDQPKRSLFETFFYHLNSLSDYNYQVLSSTSLKTISSQCSESESGQRHNDEYLKKIFIRGFCSTIVLMKLNKMGRYFNRVIEGPITSNNMKLLRMMIHFHTVYNNDNSLLLQYCLDFINRWGPMLTPGDKVDKYDFLSLLITSYVRNEDQIEKCHPQTKDTDLDRRLKRIEKILGI